MGRYGRYGRYESSAVRNWVREFSGYWRKGKARGYIEIWNMGDGRGKRRGTFS